MVNCINNKTLRMVVYIILSLLFIAVGVLCFCNKSQYDEYSTELSIAGSLASIFGIIIAIIQILHTKSIAVVTRESAIHSEQMVKEGMEKVQKVFTLTDIMQIQHLPNEIQDAIQNKAWERAYEKMRNLKDDLVEIQNNPDLMSLEQTRIEVISKTQELELRIKAFAKGISNKKDPYAFNKALDLMEEIRTVLRTISTQVKFDNIK